MRVNAPPISAHRLNRYHRWMLLWLKWFAAFLNQARAFAPFSAQAEAIAHQWLDRREHLLLNIVMLRVLPRIRLIAPPRHSSRRLIEAHSRRAVIGASIRRGLRFKDINQRIAVLSHHIDALVSRMLKRLPRGLTRRRPHRVRPEPRVVAIRLACSDVAHADDTS